MRLHWPRWLRQGPWAFRFRKLTSIARRLPDFIIIGAARSGTTSLFNYLGAHPRISPSQVKEVHYFDMNFRKGLAWYRANFPTWLENAWSRELRSQGIMTGEASPYYLFHPRAPERVATALPRVKLIVLLRNPIDRAYSHYHHALSDNVPEPLPFEQAIEKEAERLEGTVDRLKQNQAAYSLAHHRLSYLSRGQYAGQLAEWFRWFPREQFMILKSEDLYRFPRIILQSVTDYLGLPPSTLDAFPVHNAEQYRPLAPNVRLRLIDYFRPYNQRLYELLGRDFRWEAESEAAAGGRPRHRQPRGLLQP